MTLPIRTADERISAPRQIKGVIFGESGVGKTSQLRHLPAEKTLFINLEAGDLSVIDVPADEIQARTWQECRGLAAFIGGANPAFSDDKSYSAGHFAKAVEKFGDPSQLDKYDTIFIDSITEAARLCLRWCEQQDFAISPKTGKKDGFAIYGALGQELVGWFKQLQHAPKNIWLVGILEKIQDDNNRISFVPQIDGAKAAREIDGIFDQVLTLAFDHTVQPEPGEEAPRQFVTKRGNPQGFPAKDRSGKLNMYEPADLGALMRKISTPITGEAK